VRLAARGVAVATVWVWAAGGAPASAETSPTRLARAPFAAAHSDFSAEAVVRGLAAQREDCEPGGGPGELVWADAGAHGAECLRAWTAGLRRDAPNPRVVVFFEGDVWTGREAAKRARTLGLPYAMLARPGIFGSSGDHMQRRRPAESALVAAALEALKARWGVQEWVLVGQSGGGHVAASLLTRRSDVLCAVLASTPSSPRVRWWLRGWPHDSTGWADSYEPLDHLHRDGHHPGLRIFVLGDRQDRNTPWASQTVIAERSRALGLHAQVLALRGEGESRHGLEDAAMRAARGCARDESDERIAARAAGGQR
jgi:dienelactone hydrolase